MSYSSKETWFHKKGEEFSTPHLIRYADDFVILHENLAVVQRCQQIIAEWLEDIGLELKPSKTQITHTLGKHEGNVGFNFLGFHIRQYKTTDDNSAKDSKGRILGFKALIKPSKEANRQLLHRHCHDEKTALDAIKLQRQTAYEELTRKLDDTPW